jgi:hypothetical protein
MPLVDEMAQVLYTLAHIFSLLILWHLGTESVSTPGDPIRSKTSLLHCTKLSLFLSHVEAIRNKNI